METIKKVAEDFAMSLDLQLLDGEAGSKVAQVTWPHGEELNIIYSPKDSALKLIRRKGGGNRYVQVVLRTDRYDSRIIYTNNQDYDLNFLVDVSGSDVTQEDVTRKCSTDILSRLRELTHIS